jgi:hypothetical protein
MSPSKLPIFERAQTYTELHSKDVFSHFIMQPIGGEHFGQTVR